MSLVLDGSVVLSWHFEDEQTEHTRAVLDEVIDQGALVPTHWRLEVSNALQMAIRRKRIDAAFRDRALGNLSAMAIETDSEGQIHTWTACLWLSDRHGLTMYDAAYLELAERRRSTLASLDKALIKAARAEGVPVVGI